PKCLGGNLGDFGEFCKGLDSSVSRNSNITETLRRIGRAFFAVQRDSDAGGNESVTVLTVGWASAHQLTSKNEETVG
ncbi:hypothetical protein KEM39_00595, partial [Neisseria sp. Marseille-Q1983]|uniref:hypothetical protein n=1 Tax=Neisseria sp. Marseille-Q1983 TaxID=2830768 RepID=UPI001BA8348B|nr:hypothetical protein [Neisseria sp. Marseille-Q1983]